MILKINNREYKLYIGLRFIDEIDKIYAKTGIVTEFGLGLGKLGLKLMTADPVALANFIMAATCTDDYPPTIEEVEAFLMEKSPEEIDQLAVNFIEALSANSLTQKTVAGQIDMIAMFDKPTLEALEVLSQIEILKQAEKLKEEAEQATED